jgi:acetyl-CoA acetyltransferase
MAELNVARDSAACCIFNNKFIYVFSGRIKFSPKEITDVCEFYDPFSFELIRQFEAFGFCAEGEGGDYVMSGVIEPGGRHPITTDGGTMSFSHGGASVQLFQRVIRGVQQLRGECISSQVHSAEVAMCTGGGSGALFTDVLLLGKERP